MGMRFTECKANKTQIDLRTRRENSTDSALSAEESIEHLDGAGTRSLDEGDFERASITIIRM